MNTNESDFERELRALRPLVPSPSLDERIALELGASRQLATVEAAPAPIRWREPESDAGNPLARFFAGLGWAMGGAAAALAVIAVIHATRAPTSPARTAAATSAVESDFEPSGITREFVAAEDGGIVYDDDQATHLVRYTTLERHAWTDLATGAQLEVEVPRVDVILMPVAMQ